MLGYQGTGNGTSFWTPATVVSVQNAPRALNGR